MATVTALRERRAGFVEVEVDGSPWRSLPMAAVVRTGLASGTELDRERVRLLRRELRRAEALGLATRALSRRDLPATALDARLERRGVRPAARREAVEALERAGIVDDGRFARGRAERLAERGFGDAAIRWQLEREGVRGEAADETLALLETESARADRVVARRGAGPATARFLSARGFPEDVVEAALERASGADGYPGVG